MTRRWPNSWPPRARASTTWGYRVEDCAVALQSVKDAGGRVIDEAPRPGPQRGTTVAFVHPKTSFGTLIELVEE